jgi:hypothetical protein
VYFLFRTKGRELWRETLRVVEGSSLSSAQSESLALLGEYGSRFLSFRLLVDESYYIELIEL